MLGLSFVIIIIISIIIIIILTLKFWFEGCVWLIVLRNKTVLKISLEIFSSVIFDHVNVTYKYIKYKFNFNWVEAQCMFAIAHTQAQTLIAKYQFVSWVPGLP